MTGFRREVPMGEQFRCGMLERQWLGIHAGTVEYAGKFGKENERRPEAGANDYEELRTSPGRHPHIRGSRRQ